MRNLKKVKQVGIVSEGQCCKKPKPNMSKRNGYDIDICENCGKYEYL